MRPFDCLSLARDGTTEKSANLGFVPPFDYLSISGGGTTEKSVNLGVARSLPLGVVVVGRRTAKNNCDEITKLICIKTQRSIWARENRVDSFHASLSESFLPASFNSKSDSSVCIFFTLW